MLFKKGEIFKQGWCLTRYSVGVTDRSSLYDVSTEVHPNTYLCMMEESRHVAPFGSVRPSFTLVSLEAGAKIGEISGFRFDILGGFNKTDDAHFLLLNGGQAPSDASNPFIEVLRPVYANLSHSFIGGGISTNVYAPLQLSLRLKKNFYKVTDLTINEVTISDPKAYNKPGIELDVQGTWQVTNSLKFTAGYHFEGDRLPLRKKIEGASRPQRGCDSHQRSFRST